MMKKMLGTELQRKMTKKRKDIPCELDCFSSRCAEGMLRKFATRETRRKSWQEIQPCEELKKQTQTLAYSAHTIYQQHENKLKHKYMR
jgi:hypothetical protein